MLSELTVVLWKWGKLKYSASYVNKMSSMLSRHLHIPHNIICLTDDPTGVEVECYALPVVDHYIMSNINLRRLWIFSDEAAVLLGNRRTLQLDLDMVITSDITPLVLRSEPFLIWKYIAPTTIGFALNPSVMLFTPGIFSNHWRDFIANPFQQYHAARRARCSGSDQSLITYWFTAPIPNQLTRSVLVPVWTNLDGIYWSRELQSNASSPGALPADARIVSFHGRRDPKQQASKWPWINEHWR